MSKIICDICGTTYPDTADCCPICGCSRDSAMDFLGDTVEAEEIYDDGPARKGRYSAKKRKEIFDYDEVNPQMDETEILDEESDEEEEGEEESSHTSTGLIVGLTVLIATLLLAAAFLFVRFILPSFKSDSGTREPAGILQDTPNTTGETELFIPCQYITLSSGGAVLNAEGQFFLLHVVPTPEDTTETIYYAIEDESIATVSEDGKITAVSEGETTVYITCGNSQITCPVTVKYEEETVPTTVATEATEAAEEQTAATEAPAKQELKNVTLKLKKTDIMLGVGYKVQLVLDCDLEPTEVDWVVEHEHIASVDEEGWVKARKYGTTSVTAKYGDQEVKCMVRCG